MQILTIIVQNTSDYRDLGVATSGVTFFRALGSSFGAAVFGAIYSGQLETVLPPRWSSRPGSTRSDGRLPGRPAQPAGRRHRARRQRLRRRAPRRSSCTPHRSACVAFVLTLFLPEVPLRDAARAGASDLGEGFGMAENADSERALEVLLARLMQREGRRALPAIRIASGTALGGAETWCVAQVLLRERHGVPADLDSIAVAHERAGQRAAAGVRADRGRRATSPATPQRLARHRGRARASGRCSAPS